jgi:hypothetical protein
MAVVIETLVRRASLSIGHRDVPISGALQQQLAVQEASVIAMGGDGLATRRDLLRAVTKSADSHRASHGFYSEGRGYVQRVSLASREVGGLLQRFLEQLYDDLTRNRNRLRQEIFDQDFREQAEDRLNAIYAEHFAQAFEVVGRMLKEDGRLGSRASQNPPK